MMLDKPHDAPSHAECWQKPFTGVSRTAMKGTRKPTCTAIRCRQTSAVVIVQNHPVIPTSESRRIVGGYLPSSRIYSARGPVGQSIPQWKADPRRPTDRWSARDPSLSVGVTHVTCRRRSCDVVRTWPESKSTFAFQSAPVHAVKDGHDRCWIATAHSEESPRPHNIPVSCEVAAGRELLL